MFSLDVYHVLQFYGEALAEPISHNNSLLFFDYLDILGLFWNLDIFWELLEYVGYFRDPSSGFHQLIFDAARAIPCAFQEIPIDLGLAVNK